MMRMSSPSGVAQTTRWISASMLMGFVVVTHGGCELPPCPPGYKGPLDNREGQVDPDSDADYYCFKIPPPAPPPPVPPDVSADKPSNPANLRDREAVARAAIFVQSCKPDFLFPGFNINTHIDANYGAIMSSGLEQAIFDRVNCFRWKMNGCDAVRECVGIAVTPTEPAFAPGCNKRVAMRRIGVPPEPVYDVWMDCGINTHQYDNEEFDLECYPFSEPVCAPPRVNCPSDMLAPECSGSRPWICEYASDRERFVSYNTPTCGDFGLACTVDGENPACTGSGPACNASVTSDGEFFADFRSGIACEDEKTLRTCVNGHEHMLDCTSLGMKLKCIGGSRPHCGADFQCNYDGSNPLPTCDGTSINFCNAGVPTTIDCTALGFETCDPERGICK